MKKRALQLFCIVCLIAYLILLTKFIIFKYPDAMTSDILNTWSLDRLVRQIQTANFIPFRTISNSLFNAQLRVEVPTLIYNIAAFIPLGFLLPCIVGKGRRFIVALVAGFILSFAFEFVQLMTGLGSADIDDIVLNVTGTLIGYALFRLASAIYQQTHKTLTDRHRDVTAT